MSARARHAPYARWKGVAAAATWARAKREHDVRESSSRDLRKPATRSSDEATETERPARQAADSASPCERSYVHKCFDVCARCNHCWTEPCLCTRAILHTRATSPAQKRPMPDTLPVRRTVMPRESSLRQGEPQARLGGALLARRPLLCTELGAALDYCAGAILGCRIAIREA